MNNKERKKRVEKRAAALRYDPPEDSAPRLVASGRGEVAERIIRMAEEHDLPLYEDQLLAETLTRLKLGTEIPEELYQAVAEILGFIYRMDKKKGREKL